MKIARDELQRAQTLEILGQAMPLSKAQIREEFNLRTPSNKEDEVTFMPPPTPDVLGTGFEENPYVAGIAAQLGLKPEDMIAFQRDHLIGEG
jgi:hypothetical protein